MDAPEGRVVRPLGRGVGPVAGGRARGQWRAQWPCCPQLKHAPCKAPVWVGAGGADDGVCKGKAGEKANCCRTSQTEEARMEVGEPGGLAEGSEHGGDEAGSDRTCVSKASPRA